MTRRVVARAPVRLDFGGGWTDVPPYDEEEGGFVCNVAIARYATATLTIGGGAASGEGSDLARAALRREGPPGGALTLTADFPLGAGLGGSSAAGVAALAACHAWRGETLRPAVLAEESRRLEVEDLGVAGGRQDHYAAAFGGALALRFGDGVTVERIPLSDATAAALERRCVLVYSGASRISGATITAVLDAYRRREPGTCAALRAMRGLAGVMAERLAAGDVDALGELVGEHWEHQRALHPAITTPAIDAILDAARRAGALGGKALGASGGGCVLVFAPEERVDAVRAAVAAIAEPLPFTIAREGVRVHAEAEVA